MSIKETALKLFISLLLSTSAIAANMEIGDQFKVGEVLKEEMKGNEKFKGAKVEASSLDGFVTLNGYVDNLWQKKRLVEISQAINGVKGVIDKLSVGTVSVDSEALAKKVALSLYRDPVADVHELTVTTDDHGRVLLSGKADSDQEIRAAEDAAQQVKGVVFTKNEIERVESEEPRTESETRQDLEFALANDVLIDSSLLETQVDSGRAEVKGEVGSVTEAQAVENVSTSVEGVQEVGVTELKVVPRFDRSVVFKISPSSENYSDASLARMVDEANYYDTRVFSYNIDVNAKNGVVELKGTAKSEEAKTAALENAENTIGVKRVVDNIEIDEFASEQELLAE